MQAVEHVTCGPYIQCINYVRYLENVSLTHYGIGVFMILCDVDILSLTDLNMFYCTS